jgi:competence protein ComEA
VAQDGRLGWAVLAFSFLLLVRGVPWPARAARPVGAPPERGAARLLWGLPLDLEREAAGELEALPGIGPGRARALVAGRPYCSFRDLDRVPGIGPATLRRLSGKVRVGRSPRCARAMGD